MTPIIGISTNLHTVDKGKFLGMERIYVNKDYIDAVVKACLLYTSDAADEL